MRPRVLLLLLAAAAGTEGQEDERSELLSVEQRYEQRLEEEAPSQEETWACVARRAAVVGPVGIARRLVRRVSFDAVSEGEVLVGAREWHLIDDWLETVWEVEEAAGVDAEVDVRRGDSVCDYAAAWLFSGELGWCAPRVVTPICDKFGFEARSWRDERSRLRIAAPVRSCLRLKSGLRLEVLVGRRLGRAVVARLLTGCFLWKSREELGRWQPTRFALGAVAGYHLAGYILDEKLEELGERLTRFLAENKRSLVLAVLALWSTATMGPILGYLAGLDWESLRFDLFLQLAARLLCALVLGRLLAQRRAANTLSHIQDLEEEEDEDEEEYYRPRRGSYSKRAARQAQRSVGVARTLSEWASALVAMRLSPSAVCLCLGLALLLENPKFPGNPPRHGRSFAKGGAEYTRMQLAKLRKHLQSREGQAALERLAPNRRGAQDRDAEMRRFVRHGTALHHDAHYR